MYMEDIMDACRMARKIRESVREGDFAALCHITDKEWENIEDALEYAASAYVQAAEDDGKLFIKGYEEAAEKSLRYLMDSKIFQTEAQLELFKKEMF